jgi:hypothetical protein
MAARRALTGCRHPVRRRTKTDLGPYGFDAI